MTKFINNSDKSDFANFCSFWGFDKLSFQNCSIFAYDIILDFAKGNICKLNFFQGFDKTTMTNFSSHHKNLEKSAEYWKNILNLVIFFKFFKKAVEICKKIGKIFKKIEKSPPLLSFAIFFCNPLQLFKDLPNLVSKIAIFFSKTFINFCKVKNICKLLKFSLKVRHEIISHNYNILS